MSRDELKECGEKDGPETVRLPCLIAHKLQAQMFYPGLESRREQVLLQICFGGRNYVCFTMALAGLGRRGSCTRTLHRDQQIALEVVWYGCGQARLSVSGLRL
jgi:hypothetical protein